MFDFTWAHHCAFSCLIKYNKKLSSRFALYNTHHRNSEYSAEIWSTCFQFSQYIFAEKCCSMPESRASHSKGTLLLTVQCFREILLMYVNCHCQTIVRIMQSIDSMAVRGKASGRLISGLILENDKIAIKSIFFLVSFLTNLWSTKSLFCTIAPR